MKKVKSTGPRSRTIRENMWQILRILAEVQKDESGEAWMSGSQIRESTDLSPSEINDAIRLLSAQGLVESHSTYTTLPFDFAVVCITPEGRYEIERIESGKSEKDKKKEKTDVLLPWEEIVASGLSELGYNLVENMTVAPSGTSIDFVMEHEGQLIGVEVKTRNVEPDDLKGTLDTRSALDLENMMVVSNREFETDTQKFAEENSIQLKTIENILEAMNEAKLSTTQFKKSISNLMNFTRKQVKPSPSLLKEFAETLEKTLAAETNKEKKDSLERLAEILVNMIEGLEVIDKDVNTKTEEIDHLVKNESKDQFWQRLPSPFLIECKNWSNPVSAKEIRDFDGKMDEITFRIMIAINGITGRSEREDAKGVIRDARKKGRHIVVLDKEDLKDIAKGVHPAEKINAKYYELFKL